MEESAAKRPRIFDVEYEETVQLLGEIKEFYSKLPDASFLWDTSRSWELPRPTRYPSGYNSSPTYSYVGRSKAENLYRDVLAMRPGTHMQILGAKGTGKSTVACSIAGYLQGSDEKRVVYLCVDRFVAEPETVFLEALLMSCRKQEEWQGLIPATSMQDLIFWCKTRPRGSLLFVVDDWDKFELPGNEKLEMDIIAACSSRHTLVKLSSVNSRTRQIWSMSDKGDELIKTVFFDGPFNDQELATWIGQSKLRDEHLQHLDRLTGGIPRLLRFYENAEGNEAGFLQATDMYAKSLHNFVVELESLQELRAAVELVTEGNASSALTGKKLTCFYKDDKKNVYHMLTPHLRSLADRYLMEQNAALHSRLLLVDMQTWSGAVRLDLDEHGNANPARVGWIIEGLIIAMILFRRKLFSFEFHHFRTYEHGQELSALKKVPREQLEQGVLFIPAAFNEKAVDVVYVKLEKQELIVKGVQITIALWKAKAKKGSHQTWQTEILPKWKPKICNKVSSEFYYVMPEGATLDDISDSTKMKRFQEIDQSLAEFDDLLLELSEPKKLAKTELKTCCGQKRDGSPCQNKAHCAGDFRCFHHQLPP